MEVMDVEEDVADLNIEPNAVMTMACAAPAMACAAPTM